MSYQLNAHCKAYVKPWCKKGGQKEVEDATAAAEGNQEVAGAHVVEVEKNQKASSSQLEANLNKKIKQIDA